MATAFLTAGSRHLAPGTWQAGAFCVAEGRGGGQLTPESTGDEPWLGCRQEQRVRDVDTRGSQGHWAGVEAHSSWILPFPPLPSLPQATQTLEPTEGAGRPRTWPRPQAILGPLLPSPTPRGLWEIHLRETYAVTNTCFSLISVSYFWIQFSISVSTLYFF